MKDIYKKMYESGGKLDLVNTPRIRIMAEIINRLNLKDSHILDIGCYDGTFLSLIKNRNNAFLGIEASDFGVKKSLEKGIKAKQFFFDDKSPFPFEDGFFDVAVAGEIIEHIYDTDFFLKEIKRILKPGGKLLISTPNIASLGRRALLLLGANPIIEISPNEKQSSGHIRYFTRGTLRNLLHKHNFKILTEKPDTVNFSASGKINSKILARLFPSLAQSIIYFVRKSSDAEKYQ